MDKRLSKYLIYLTASETGIGAALHALHIPFAGHFLALNQGWILSLATQPRLSRYEASKIVLKLSQLACLTKSLSPMGKKLTPMLAILTQGTLFNFGILLFGTNFLGLAVGNTLLCSWGILQPILLAYVFFGAAWWQEIYRSILQAQGTFTFQVALWFFGSLFVLKVFVGLMISYFVTFNSQQAERKYETLSQHIHTKFTLQLTQNKVGSAWYLSLKDLAHPWFLFSLALSLLLFIYHQDYRWIQLWQWGIRPVAFAYLTFLCFRLGLPYLEPKISRILNA